jgi:O-antigen ligase
MRAAIPKSETISFFKSIQNGLPLFFLLLVDLISFKSAQGGGELASEQDPTRVIVFGGIYCVALWIIYLRRVDYYSLMRGHWTYILFILYAFSTMFWSAYPAKTVITAGHLLGHYFVVVSVLLMFRGHEVSLLRVYCLFSYFFIPACLITALYFPAQNIYDFSGRWKGLTNNPNTLGADTMICVWANISYLFYAQRKLARIWIVAMLVGGFVLLKGAGSVTSLSLSVFAVVAVPLFYWFASSRNGVTAALKIGYSSLIIFGALGYFYATHPEIFDSNKVLGSVGRDSNMTGRTMLWGIAWQAIAEKPWFGWSFDVLQSLPSKYSINFFQFHNGYLDIMVRGGRVALFFIIAFALSTAIRVVRIAPYNKALTASFGTLLCVIMIHNYTESSFAQTPNPMWLLFTFVYLGISPRIIKWYETGLLEVTKWKWRSSTKPTIVNAGRQPIV